MFDLLLFGKTKSSSAKLMLCNLFVCLIFGLGKKHYTLTYVPRIWSDIFFSHMNYPIDLSRVHVVNGKCHWLAIQASWIVSENPISWLKVDAQHCERRKRIKPIKTGILDFWVVIMSRHTICTSRVLSWFFMNFVLLSQSFCHMFLFFLSSFFKFMFYFCPRFNFVCPKVFVKKKKS